jgi:hypothetical protein
LTPFDDQGIEFQDVFADLITREWLREDDGLLVLTRQGRSGPATRCGAEQAIA